MKQPAKGQITFWVCVFALLLSGVVQGRLTEYAYRVSPLLAEEFNLGVLSILLICTPFVFAFVGAGLGIAITRFPSFGFQFLAYGLVLIYAAVAYTLLFGLRLLGENAALMMLSVWGAIVATGLSAVTIPYWFARYTQDSGWRAYLLFASTLIGHVAATIVPWWIWSGAFTNLMWEPTTGTVGVLAASCVCLVLALFLWVKCRRTLEGNTLKDVGPPFSHSLYVASLFLAPLGMFWVTLIALVQGWAVDPVGYFIFALTYTGLVAALAQHGPWSADSPGSWAGRILQLICCLTPLIPFGWLVLSSGPTLVSMLMVLMPPLFFLLFALPRRIMLVCQLVLLIPSLVGIIFLDELSETDWIALPAVFVFWVWIVRCYGRLAELAPPPMHLPQYVASIFLGQAIVMSVIMLNMAYAYQILHPAAEYVFFLLLGVILPLLPVGRKPASRPMAPKFDAISFPSPVVLSAK